MIIIKEGRKLQEYLSEDRANGHRIGFVPTMGALHKGHLSLLEEAAVSCEVVVCSIFVNPTQFNDPADFEKYPVTIEKDITMLASMQVKYLFLPAVDALYPSGLKDLENYDLGQLEHELEGRFRPGHFQGVCQVMARLLQHVSPDMLFMGQKDYQQCLVVDRLLELIGSSAVLVKCKTVREASGLAMSSRNVRLNASDRAIAPEISKVLRNLASKAPAIPLATAREEARQQLEQQHFRIDYIEVAYADTLEILKDWDDQKPMVAVAAAYLDGVRLIDNVLIDQ